MRVDRRDGADIRIHIPLVDGSVPLDSKVVGRAHGNRTGALPT